MKFFYLENDILYDNFYLFILLLSSMLMWAEQYHGVT